MRFTFALSALMMGAASAGMITGTITVTNRAPVNGTCITPLWVGIHTGTFDSYDRNQPLPGFMELLVEDGATGDVANYFNNEIEGGAFETTIQRTEGGPMCPGESGSFDYEFDEDIFPGQPLYFSYASMIIPSNDAWVGNANPQAFLLRAADGAVNDVSVSVMGSMVLDGGTEQNDELTTSAAFLGNPPAPPGSGTPENATVIIHPGFIENGPILMTENGSPRGLSFTGANFRADGYQVADIEVTAAVAEEGEEQPAASNDGGCFSAESMVDVMNVGEVAMKDLQVGDYVLTGRNNYEPVYAFSHLDEAVSAEFLKLTYQEAGKARSLEVTEEHLVYKAGESTPVRASTLVAGDVLAHLDSTEAKITKISKVNRAGIYAPLTQDGSIVVDGIVASVYATLMAKTDSAQIEFNEWTVPVIDQATFLHYAVAPLRMVCGVSSQFGICQTEGNKGDAQGYHPYVSWGVDMIRWVENQNAAIQGLLTAAFFAAFSAINVAESVSFGTGNSALKFMMTVACVVAYNAASRKSQKTAA